jgi:hypothetical protein
MVLEVISVPFFIVLDTKVFRDTFSSHGSVEHPTQGETVYITSMDAKSDDAARELIYHDKDPVAL